MKSWPVPLSATLCGLSGTIVRNADSARPCPCRCGLKVTEIVQLAPALTVVPQVLVWEKSPLAAMLEIVSEAVPVLLRVTS